MYPHYVAAMLIRLAEHQFRATLRAALPDAAGLRASDLSEGASAADGDVLLATFRCLSASVLPGVWLEFPADVLRPSAALLTGRTVYTDHRVEARNWVGVVRDACWDADGARAGGVPGVNATLAIDRVTEPKVARGVELGALRSVSVGVRFDAAPSHPALWAQSPGRYLSALGEVMDGEPVRIVATEILGYDEISLVWEGADPLAKRLSSPDAPADGLRGALARLLRCGDRDEELLDAARRLLATAERIESRERRECERWARVALAVEGDLPPVVAEVIRRAPVETLPDMTDAYRAAAERRFPCGGRSSRETPRTPPARPSPALDEFH